MGRDYTMEERAALDKCTAAFGVYGNEQDRLSNISDALINYNCNDEDELKEKFGPGSHGHSQAIDRIFVQAQVWDDFIAESPAILLHKDAFELAGVISMLMGSLYQKVAGMPDEVDDKPQDKPQDKTETPYLSDTIEKMVEEFKSSHDKIGKIYEDISVRVVSEFKKVMSSLEKHKK